MTIERLFEAAMRLAKADGREFENMNMEVLDQFYAVASGIANGGRTFKRRSTLTVLAKGSWVAIGRAEVDLNGIVLEIKYSDAAPWWAVKPIQEAMEGK